jgi:hypothetical protein
VSRSQANTLVIVQRHGLRRAFRHSLSSWTLRRQSLGRLKLVRAGGRGIRGRHFSPQSLEALIKRAIVVFTLLFMAAYSPSPCRMIVT